MSSKDGLTAEWVDSDRCNWPPVIKAKAKAIIKLSAEIKAVRSEVVGVNMMEPEKIRLLYLLGTNYQKLSTAYTELAKELAYQVSRGVKD